MRLFFLLVFLLYSLDGISYGGSRKQQIDEINSNSTSNLILNPTSDVIFDNLNATTVPYLDGSKAIKSSSVTPTELGYLSGVSSSIQTQLNAKVDDSTTITTTSPLFIDGIGSANLSTNRTLSIQQATSLANGYLSSTDWTTFNNKFDSPLTTKGDLLSRDASTHMRLGVGSNGQILSADSAEVSGLKWINPPSTGITSLNSLTNSTQTFATGTSGTDFNISSVTSTHTFNFPDSSSTNRGLLTSSDWTTFNSKLGKSGTFTDNCVLRSDGTGGVAQCGGYDIDDSGNLINVDGVFFGSANANLLFDIGSSTTHAVKPFPVLTTTQRNALTAQTNSFIQNSTDGALQWYNGSSWQNVGGGVTASQYNSSKYYVLVKNSGTQSCVASTIVKANFATEDADTANVHSAGDITIPANGSCTFCYLIQVTPSSGYRYEPYLYLNGSQHLRGNRAYSGGASNMHIQSCWTLPVTSGQVWSFRGIYGGTDIGAVTCGADSYYSAMCESNL